MAQVAATLSPAVSARDAGATGPLRPFAERLIGRRVVGADSVVVTGVVPVESSVIVVFSVVIVVVVVAAVIVIAVVVAVVVVVIVVGAGGDGRSRWILGRSHRPRRR
jgi:hypothetical protein